MPHRSIRLGLVGFGEKTCASLFTTGVAATARGGFEA